MTEIAICIATRQRPQGITRTLRSLAELVTEREVTVIVADPVWPSRAATIVVVPGETPLTSPD